MVSTYRRLAGWSNWTMRDLEVQKMIRRILIKSAAFLAVITSGAASGQTLLRSKVSRELWLDLRGFEAKLMSLDDHNGDGLAEIAVGDWIFRRPGIFSPFGKVSVLDGASGEERLGVVGGYGPFQVTESLGFSVAAVGDRDGDGIGDILAGCLIGPARILSGSDGTEIYRSSGFVEQVATLGDLDRDGTPDFALRNSTAPWGAIDVLSGQTLAMLYTIRPPFLSHLYGYSIVSVGDVDADQVPDFAVSAPDHAWDDTRENCHETYVFVYSGRDGRLLYFIPRPGVDECELFGYSMAGLGDLNGDGIGDLVVGMPDTGYFATSLPRVYFHDGKTGQRFAEVGLPGRHHSFARVLTPIGDSNGNGYPDVLVSNVNVSGAGFSARERGEALVLDGGTREFLFRILGDPIIGPTYPGTFSLAMASLGDVDGDDFPDFLIGSPGIGALSGRLDWFSGAPQGIRSLGEPCSKIPGVTPRIGASGVPRIGKTYEIHLSRVAPGQKAFLAVGFHSPAGLFGPRSPRGPSSPARGCGTTLFPAKLYPAVAGRTAGDEAAAIVRIPLVNDPSLVGRVLFAQWQLVGSQGTAWSRVLEITIQ